MKNLIISAAMLTKLRDRHSVSLREVEQCFGNQCGLYLEDDREDHQTDPPSLWFVAPTNQGRMLKVIFIFLEGNVHIKSAFESDSDANAIYERYGK